MLAKAKNIVYFLRKSRTKLYHFFLGDVAPNPGEVIYIDPQKIVGHLESRKRGWQNLSTHTQFMGGAVVSGDWDLDYVTYLNFKDQQVFKSCHAHWVEGKPWEDTILYREYVDKLARHEPNRFASLEDLKNRYYGLDKIFYAVKEANTLSTEWKDLIIISIARDGRLIWGPNGRHRICVALCVGLQTIPVRVGFVHKDALDVFQKLRKQQETVLLK